MKRVLPVAALLLAAVSVVLIVGSSGDDRYVIKLRLDNAGGLRSGSPVAVGGVTVGDVKLDAAQDSVTAELRIDDNYAPLGRDATATIIAKNAIGQKTVSVSVGDRRAHPAPDGFELPTRQVRQSTDLDQLLSALDADTRTRLAILLNEAGTAFAGRKMDFKRLLVQAPLGLDSGGRVLGQLARDNRALEQLVTTGDRYVGTLAAERKRIARMLDVLGRTTETVAARRAALRDTLRRAPAALSSTRSFLAELRRTAGPLGSTARLLGATAPSLRTTLERIEPLREVAAPLLGELRTDAAPGFAELNPTNTFFYRARRSFELAGDLMENELPPVGRTLDGSMDNLLATMDNWARAIQFRDRLSHVFRGEASISPEIYESLLRRLGGRSTQTMRPQRERKAPSAPPPASAQPPADQPRDQRPRLPRPVDRLTDQVEQATGQVEQLVDDLVNGLLPKPAPSRGDVQQGVVPLLDYLLG